VQIWRGAGPAVVEADAAAPAPSADSRRA
jgi:hypothetical protein